MSCEVAVAVRNRALFLGLLARPEIKENKVPNAIISISGGPNNRGGGVEG
jgi:hypothetical protein